MNSFNFQEPDSSGLFDVVRLNPDWSELSEQQRDDAIRQVIIMLLCR